MDKQQTLTSQPQSGLLALRDVLERKQVQELLFVGKRQDAEKMLMGMKKPPRLHLADVQAEEPTMPKRCWNVGIVHHVLSEMDWQAAQRLLSRLRDIHCRSVYLCWRRCDEQGSLAGVREKIRALGYTPLGSYGEDVIACFDIDDYKQVPSWLNARHWARPELWNKFRW